MKVGHLYKNNLMACINNKHALSCQWKKSDFHQQTSQVVTLNINYLKESALSLMHRNTFL